ncbi:MULTISPECIES: pyridoxal 5'-phosphate synthase glutaminase subunit PdxT [Dactylosporangium]|uniref:Pyridoxal 5'-phosphate synthase subunit PdxT n=2 Tax=Dactylosporangium TaxID=35753 RepID=A0A9W6NMK9_9ACTN|nr:MULTISPECIES: pyridoxal 5'-phosphate synthase glutaminase subunit PdxT [Dactylosporangium]UAB94695.1 pyridoxal 5'-phosphate synthase glutaminase subunit PdxT [Dactylosporangium vinaceum]UWZ43064.1 pyridoxal 5'-phosphate synthase glutaminase subunit PdxT [Dactylosporangium matsuzakiense]GLL02519.1 pyridoxal 5'-phosphate synthase subunit PdxT [Dactylosporangium matsuzakiense]
MIIGVLALQGDTREHLHAVADLDAIGRPVRRPEELDSVDALIIPGGESTTMSKLAVEFGLLEPLQKRIAAGMPAYGSCAGMIMLATTILDGRADQVPFGGIDMTVRRNAFGRQVDSFEGNVDISGIDGGSFHAVFIRAPWVEEVSDSVEVLGRVNDGPSAGRIVAVRQQHLLATAFHPELTGDLRVHRYFVEMVREAGKTTEG